VHDGLRDIAEYLGDLLVAQAAREKWVSRSPEVVLWWDGGEIGCVLAGVGWVRAVTAASSAWSAHRVAAIRVATAVVAVGTVPFLWSRVTTYPAATRAMYYQVHKYGQLQAAIGLAGGKASILQCGRIMAAPFQVPAVALDLGVPIWRITTVPGRVPPSDSKGTVFRTSTWSNTPELPSSPADRAFHVAAQTGQWQILSTC
jgi:hypothetical protein